jgi:hypothetical protein
VAQDMVSPYENLQMTLDLEMTLNFGKNISCCLKLLLQVMMKITERLYEVSKKH